MVPETLSLTETAQWLKPSSSRTIAAPTPQDIHITEVIRLPPGGQREILECWRRGTAPTKARKRIQAIKSRSKALQKRTLHLMENRVGFV